MYKGSSGSRLYQTKKFDNIYLTKTLYCSLVQSILEYCSPVWSPHTKELSDAIESVQKQFLLFALKPLGFSGFNLPRYESRLLLLKMIPLKSRRELSSPLLGFDLFRGHIRCPELKDKLIINSHEHHTRYRKMFVEELHRTNYAYHNPINECIRGMNSYSMHYDA